MHEARRRAFGRAFQGARKRNIAHALTLLLPATAIVLVAAFGSESISGVAAAVVIAGVCLAAPPLVGASIILVAALDPHMLRDAAIGRITPVDIAVGATLIRASFRAGHQRPTLVEACALGFLAAAAGATAIANEGSALTAFARVAGYLAVGLIVGRALDARQRIKLARVFVGAQIGQATAALLTLTPSSPTRFPIGRYLGTLGDPAQFGILVAFAGVLVAVSPRIVSFPRLRRLLLAMLAIGVLGSVTRSAWAVFVGGILLAALERAGRRRSYPVRLALISGGVAATSAAVATFVIGAGTLGLNEESASIRGDSIKAGWNYLVAHPLRPLGLGNRPPPVWNATSVDGRGDSDGAISPAHLITNFENGTSGWHAHRGAAIARQEHDSISGKGSLKVRTIGIERGEGAYLPSIVGIRSTTAYTFSLYAKIAKGVRMWLYADEYDPSNQWVAYGYTVAIGQASWRRYSRTWITHEVTAQVRLYLVTAEKVRTTFTIDAAQLGVGTKPLRMTARNDRIPQPPRESISVPYNTWLSVAISLGLLAALLLAVLAISGAYRAYSLGDHAVAFALAALLAPSMTENLVYGANSVTLLWFITLGIVAGAPAIWNPGNRASQPGTLRRNRTAV